MARNSAAWINRPKARPLEVKDAPYPIPGPNDVVVQSVAVAINPLEFKIQDANPPVAGNPISYPAILGADLAGIVVSIGEKVTTRAVGQRIIANCNGIQTAQPARSAFQTFVLLDESFTTIVPDHVLLEEAVVLPLAMDTACAGLFNPDETQLALSTHHLGGQSHTAPLSDSVLLIWGGSSSVGCCAIQAAVAAGYEVYTAAGVANHALCRSLGAARVFDHRDVQVEQQMIAALKGKRVVGALDCVVNEERTMKPLSRVLANTEGVKKIAAVLTPLQEQYEGGVRAVRLSIPGYRRSEAYGTVHGWMAKALENGGLKPKPEPLTVGHGLASLQVAMDKLREGVSATKLIVRL